MSDFQLVDLSRNFPDGSVKQSLFREIMQRPVEEILGIPDLNRIYSDAEKWSERGECETSFHPILKSMGVEYEVVHGSMETIPKTGPVIVVANHPFGGVDGIILGDLLSRHREDSCLMGNFLLKHIPLITEQIIAVDPFGSATSTHKNRQGLKDTLAWLKEGRCLGAFPAGIVAHLKWSTRRITEGDWHSSLARLAQKTQATIVPVHFEGTNSKLFHALGLIHPRLRTAALVREVSKKRGAKISLRIGSAIQPTTLAAYEDLSLIHI